MFPLYGVRTHTLTEETSLLQGVLVVYLIAALALLAGCGGGPSAAPALQPIGVSLSPSTAQGIDQGQTKSITPTVSNDSSNKGVNWTVACATASCGSVSPTSTASGTPTTYTAPAMVASNVTVTVTATSVADTTKSASVMITVAPPPALTPPAGGALPAATVGMPYTFNLTTLLSGGTAPFTWSITSGTLPPGLTLNSSTGVISGTPFATKPSGFRARSSPSPASDPSVTCQATDSGSPPGSTSVTVSIPVNPPGPLTITSTSPLPNGTLGTAYNFTFQATGGFGALTWTLATGSTLPTGLVLSTGGLLQGTPSQSGGPFTFTITVTDSESTPMTAQQQFSITINVANNNAKLSGDFAVQFRGFADIGAADIGAEVAVVGRFTADGNGNLSNGFLDINTPGGTFPTNFAGTYTVGADNRGLLTANLAVGGTFTARFVLESGGDGRIIEFDDSNGVGTRGSGEIHKQDLTAANLTTFSGDFALGFIGDFNSLTVGTQPAGRLGVVGRFTLGTTGAFSNGHVDFTVAAGPISCQASLTGQLAGPDPNTGRGTGTATATPITPSLTCPTGTPTITFTFAYYVVGQNQAFVLDNQERTDVSGPHPLLSGSVHRQSVSTPGTVGSAVFAVVGVRGTGTTAAARVAIGQFTTSTDGLSITSGLLDRNDGGAVSLAVPFTGSLTPDPNVTGRVTISVAAAFPAFFSPATIYLRDNLKGFILDGSGEVIFGLLEPQSAPVGGFTDASLAGTYGLGTVEPATSQVSNITGAVALTTPPSTLAGMADVSLPVTPFLSADTPFSGNYTSAGSAVGRFTASATLVTVPLNFAIYEIKLGQFVAIEVTNLNTASAIIFFEQ